MPRTYKSERHHALDTNYPHQPQRLWEQAAPQRAPRGPTWAHWAMLAAAVVATLTLTLWEVAP